MKIKKLKKSQTDFSKYSLYAFRLTADQRNDLIRRLHEAKIRINKTKSDEEKTVKINEILLEAIRLGLPLVKREK